MATIVVPFDKLTIQEGINAASDSDTIDVNSAYSGPESASVTVDKLTFNITSSTTGVALTLGNGIIFLTVTGNSNVAVLGNSLENVIIGGDGNDDIEGGPGNDIIDGGAGTADIARYNNAPSAIAVDLSDTVGSNVAGGDGNDTLTGIERVYGSAHNDTLKGSSVIGEYFYGEGGNDTLVIGAGDLHFGGNDDDTFLYENGIDVQSTAIVFGGGGIDRLKFTGANGDVFEAFSDVSSIEIVEFASDGTNVDKEAILRGGEFDNAAEFATNLQVIGNNASGSTDTLTIDNTAGSSTFTTLDLSVWTFTNWGGQNDLVKVIGRDSVDEDITLSNQSETVDGGAGGIDIVRYSVATSAVNVDLSDTVGTNVSGGSGNDTLTGIERVYGSAHNDTLKGSSVIGEYFYGEGGNDTLVIGAGDVHFGGNDDDTFLYENGIDVQSTAVVFGGNGNDRLKFTGANGDVFEAFSDVSSIEIVEFASDGTNVDKEAILRGGEFDNAAEFATNLQVIGNNASGSTDTLTIDNTAGSSTFTTLDLSVWTFTNWGGQNDLVKVIGRDSINETVIGSGQDELMDGGGGNDVLDGAGGNDTASYARAAIGVTVDLAISGTAQNTVGAGSDTLSGFENLIGSDHDDMLFGSSVSNIIRAGAGDDIALLSSSTSSFPNPGNGNEVYGEAGDDILGYALTGVGQSNLGTGQIFDGGSNTDTFVFETFNSGYRADLPAQTFSAISSGTVFATLTDIENVSAGNGDDELIGNSSSNHLKGNAGDDTIEGNFGNDVLDGGTGTNTLNGGSGFDTASYEGAASAVSVSLNLTTPQATGVSTDTFISIENLTGSDHDDTLTGSNTANTVRGGEGMDFIRGKGGNDNLFGGSEVDTLRGQAGNDTLDGGSGNDILFGDAENDILRGGDGDDLLRGGSGADVHEGGLGNDTAIIDVAGDTVVELLDEGTDWVRAGINFTLPDNVENLALTGAARIGTGNELDNRLLGRAGADTLTGNGGDDVLIGNEAGDTLNGGAGSDVLIGGQGKDIMTGGADRDFFRFEAIGDFNLTTGAADIITDFSQADNERIQLNLVDAIPATGGDDPFSWIGTAAFSGAAGELRYQQIAGNTYISGNTDTDLIADFYIRLDGLVTLNAGDFVL